MTVPDDRSSISDLDEIIRSLTPVLNAGVYAYLSVPDDFDLASLRPTAIFREKEGTTQVVSEPDAKKAGCDILFSAAWITLSVRSDLNAVGLTAVVASALSKAGISCNVVAAAFHDHIFVPVDRAGDAMQVLRQLQRNASNFV